MKNRKAQTILVVDDDQAMLDSVAMLLESYGYVVIACGGGRRAMDVLTGDHVDIVLTDIKMPDVTGIELLKQMHQFNSEMPVILMTAYAELELAIDAVKEGAFDFITKPFKPGYLVHTIRKAMDYQRLLQLEKNYKTELEETVKERTKALETAMARIDSLNKESILRLTAIAEYRDTDTGAHIRRVGMYSKLIADRLGMPGDFVEQLTLASALHDIGKIGIEDKILLKPGPLTREEFDIMETHTTIGKKMLEGSPHPLLEMAAVIAQTHHEKWNGEGYPEKLTKENIPLEGRITTICDQYDAIRSYRPYKDPLDHDAAFRIITEGDGVTVPAHFDPDVLNAFKESAPEFKRIYDASMGEQRQQKRIIRL